MEPSPLCWEVGECQIASFFEHLLLDERHEMGQWEGDDEVDEGNDCQYLDRMGLCCSRCSVRRTSDRRRRRPRPARVQFETSGGAARSSACGRITEAIAEE